jgi:hypothetical protein
VLNVLFEGSVVSSMALSLSYIPLYIIKNVKYFSTKFLSPIYGHQKPGSGSATLKISLYDKLTHCHKLKRKSTHATGIYAVS